MQDIGVVQQDSTVRIMFVTRNASGAAVAPASPFENADVEIYKDGSATQRASDAGVTMTSPFDAVTGLHLVQIDLSDNTVAGFWAAGSNYHVTIQPDETVDGQTVVEVLAQFTIETDSQKSIRTFNSASFLTDTVVTTTDNTTTVVNLTDFVSSLQPAHSIHGELWLWEDSTGETEYFRITKYVDVGQKATVEAWPLGGPLSAAVAAGDKLWRVAPYAPPATQVLYDSGAVGFVVTTTSGNTSDQVNFSDWQGRTDEALLNSLWAYVKPVSTPDIAYSSRVQLVRVTAFTDPMATVEHLPENTPYTVGVEVGGAFIFIGASYANLRSINNVDLVGDGSTTPFDVQ